MAVRISMIALVVAILLLAEMFRNRYVGSRCLPSVRACFSDLARTVAPQKPFRIPSG